MHALAADGVPLRKISAVVALEFRLKKMPPTSIKRIVERAARAAA